MKFVTTIATASAALTLFVQVTDLARAGGPAQQVYHVGVASVDITPAYPIRLNGFGSRRQESEGVTNPIFAKALAIGADDQRPLVLVTVDSTGLRLSMVNDVAARLQQKAGIERDRFVVTFTHSHTAPKLNGVCDTVFSSPIPAEHQQHIDRYTRELTDSLEQVALAALKDRRPAILNWASGNVGFARNRRPAGGPVDHDLPMLVVRSTDEQQIRAIYVSYACHCVTLSDNRISGDWAGFAATAIEHRHPGAIAMISIGFGSDADPDSGVSGRNYAVAAEQGGQIAAEVDRLLQGPLTTISGTTRASMKLIDLPLAPHPTRTELETVAANSDPAGYNAKFQLAKLDRGEKLVGKIDYPVQSWTFGSSLALVFLGGEVCVDYARRLETELDPSRIWLHGYSNDLCCYIPSERLLREGGYGGGDEIVYFGLPAKLSSGLEGRIVGEVLRQLPDSFDQPQSNKKHAAARSLSPKESLAAIQVGEDLTVELVAAEPLVADPVAIDFGADGRLWVAEMRDYARDVDEQFEQTGQISLLTDRDGDGVFDGSQPFAGGLRFPTDVKVWRRGVLVCDAPDVLYLEDTDGDGRADVRKVLLSGFATHNPQARVNSLRWGLDGWLYGSCGLFGGDITSLSGKRLQLGGRDFRFQPATGQLEAVTGRTQQGRVRDDWQNWFGCENGSFVDHYPLTDRYHARNPQPAAPADELSVPLNDDAKRLHPVGELMLFQESGPPGRATSVCGLDIYRDELLGAEYTGNSFSCEPVNRLVHRLVLSPRGVTFTGTRPPAEAQREFLASTDPWFRPVQVRTGPDGCLWVVDMHRLVIEHPRFIPIETLRRTDVRAGSTTGRIFRVRPANQEPRMWLRLSDLDTSGLVAALESSNGPQRDLAHELLIERNDLSAIPGLSLLFENSQRPEVRLQALHTLVGLNNFDSAHVVRALKDTHPAIRRHAVQLSESFIARDADVGTALLTLAEDCDPQVQMQLAYSLGEWKDPRACATLTTLAARHFDDPYRMSAVVSSINQEMSAAFVSGVTAHFKEQPLPPTLLEVLVAIAVRLGDRECVFHTLSAAARLDDSDLDRRLAAAANLLRGLDDDRREELQTHTESNADLARVIARARQVLDGQEGTDDTLVSALQVLIAGNTDLQKVQNSVSELLGPQSAPSRQLVAIDMLAGIEAPWAAEVLLENWSRYTPAVREQALATFLERDSLLKQLISAIESGDVKTSEISALVRQQLLTHPKEDIRIQADSAFREGVDSTRAQVLQNYASVEKFAGDSDRGRLLFGTHCSNCHRLDGQGYAVGPDLAALSNRSIPALVESLLDPNRSIDERYQTYCASTHDGLTHAGILLRENAGSITLLEQGGKEVTLLRDELDDLLNTRVSLMPEGFERDLTPQDVADVLAYITDQDDPPKQFPGNEPTIVVPDEEGHLHLLATHAEIRGTEIVFEPPFQNVGYWHHEADRVSWSVRVPAGGEYDVEIEWACAENSAGNAVVIEGFAEPLRFVVPSTGGFEKYQTMRVGSTRLNSESHRIVVRADGPLQKRNLLDLRSIRLVANSAPVGAGGSNDFRVKRRFSTIPADASAEIAALLSPPKSNANHEYEHIPAIWRIALKAGRANNSHELQRLVQFALPRRNERVDHWRVVVLGGGVVNGLSQVGVPPGPRIRALSPEETDFLDHWDYICESAQKIADDEQVPIGTRYDALRILGTASDEVAVSRLRPYLERDTHAELQHGATEALCDLGTNSALDTLIGNFRDLNARNQQIALQFMLRNEHRIGRTLRAVEQGEIPRDAFAPGHLKILDAVETASVRDYAREVLGKQKN